MINDLKVKLKPIYCGTCAKRFPINEVLFLKSSSGLENPSCPHCEDKISLSALELPHTFIKDTIDNARKILQKQCAALDKDENSFEIKFVHVFSKEEISGSILIWDKSVSSVFTAEEFDKRHIDSKYFPYYRTLIGDELDLMNFPYPAIYTYVEVKNDEIKRRPVIDLLLN